MSNYPEQQDSILALEQLMARYVAAHSLTMLIEYDSAWPTPCYQEKAEDGAHVPWKPIKRSPSGDLTAIEHGLGLTIHPDIHAFYGGYWSDNLTLTIQGENVELLQVLNDDDFQRLQQNLVGHVLMKKKLKQPVTLFIGLTDFEDQIITLDNTSGKVMLERVGLESTHSLANSLSEFLNELSIS